VDENGGHSEKPAPTGGEGAAAPELDVIVAADGAAGIVTLNRPAARNALTTAMRAAIADGFRRWGRDPAIYAVLVASAADGVFCAGGDLKEMTDWGKTRRADARAALAAEYALNWRLDCFSKPTVALMDGVVMGSGVGITLYGTHRVAGENYRFAMPETGVGLFPDVGTSWVLARLPDDIGMYLALTGRAVSPADAYQLGLVTHCIPAARFGEIRAALCGADPVDPVLELLHDDPGLGELEALRPAIARCFSAPTVEAVLARLRAERGLVQTWAEGVLEALQARSPTSLKITHRLLALAPTLDLRECLIHDYRIACRCLEAHDLYEGVRALLVDRDQTPRWQPAGLEDVTEAMVAAYIAPLALGELELPSRDEMQAVAP